MFVSYKFFNLYYVHLVINRFSKVPSFCNDSNILIQASNGASDYGNKFGEPIILGFTRSFKNKDYDLFNRKLKVRY